MQLFRADRGDRKGEFLLVSGAARVAETELLKKAFLPLNELALELGGYLD